jgi:sigma-54 dependent transcriptional regulator, acetoin dehydrogenase operon transcriptional activator AcoR
MVPDPTADQTPHAAQIGKSHAEFVRQACTRLTCDVLQAETEPYIIAAWERCLTEYRLEPDRDPPSEHVDSGILEERRAQLGPLAQIVRAEMRRLFGQIAPSHYLLLLTDAAGLILERMCEPGHEELLRRVNLAPGFIWDEQHEGTNGPGTCLHDRRPRLVHRAEHFFTRNVRMTCSAAPLWGPNGQLLGVLDASHFDCPDSRQSQVPTLALISTSTRIVEQSYFIGSFKDCWIVRVYDQTELADQLHAAMLAVDEHGQIRAADSTAPARLGLDGYDAIVGRSIADVFSISVSRFFHEARTRPYQISHATDCNGNLLYVGIWPPQEAQPLVGSTKIEAEPQSIRRTRNPAPHLGDPVVAHNLWCAQRVMNRDIHILLQGETGTGKDTFARAIHNSGERRDKPFMALSCAAIPETLIESELFGYEAGAFTGARAGGMRGKVVAAQGGTLFLDEIGDMPLSLQARLLRLLEDKEVMPLGRSRPITVDIRVISATNRDLMRMVMEGSFRKDLYYRLSGLVLTMPPLHERQDLAKLIEAVAAEENGDAVVQFTPDSLAALRDYRWPGNIRELRNILATAIALAGGQPIERRHLGSAFGGVMPAETPQSDPATPLAAAERERLLLELKRRHWNATATAAALGISRNTLYRKLRKHGVRVTADEPGTH